MNIIPTPPSIPSEHWVEAFVADTLRQDPSMTLQTARQSADLAHPWGWLLDGAEAAQWWSLAVKEALAHNPRSRRWR